MVNELRESVLKDFDSMSRYCQKNGGKLVDGTYPSYGYEIESEHYLYRLRCIPTKGDYNGYLTCFDKRAAQENLTARRNELAEINKRISPFDISVYENGKYTLALRFSFFDGEYKDYGQAAFDGFAISNGEAAQDDLGLNNYGSGYDWEKVFKLVTKDIPGAEQIEYNSEAGCFFVNCDEYETIKACGERMKEVCDDSERFAAVVKEALTVIGRVSFANGEEIEYNNAEEYIKAIKEELPHKAANGFEFETLTEDPQVRKAVDDIVCDLYGEQNPRSVEDYESASPTMGEMTL